MFWDTSALIPCLVPEVSSAAATALLSDDDMVIIWWATPVEAMSALERKRRTGLEQDVYQEAVDRLTDLMATADEVQPNENVRHGAFELLREYELRAADALQLSAARFVTELIGDSKPRFATLDQRLGTVAREVGFEVVPPIPTGD